jgi:hypothetical protein
VRRHTSPSGSVVSSLAVWVQVDWMSEQACFHSLCEEIANFYMIQPDLYLSSKPDSTATEPASAASAASSSSSSSSAAAAASSAASNAEPSLRWVVQHVLFPNLRASSFHPPRRLATDSPPTVTQVAALEQLYKIFERC